MFLNSVLSKRYHSPSADIIEILAGLDDIDAVFGELVTTLETTIRTGKNGMITCPADDSEPDLCSPRTTDGGQRGNLRRIRSFPNWLAYLLYTTGSLSIAHPGMTDQRFICGSPLIECQLIQDVDRDEEAMPALVLIGLLANYNKFETHNPYQSRLAGLYQEQCADQIASCIGSTFQSLRDQYISIQNDLPEGWSIGGTLSYISLGLFAGAKPVPAVPTEEQAKVLFTEQCVRWFHLLGPC